MRPSPKGKGWSLSPLGALSATWLVSCSEMCVVELGVLGDAVQLIYLMHLFKVYTQLLPMNLRQLPTINVKTTCPNVGDNKCFLGRIYTC